MVGKLCKCTELAWVTYSAHRPCYHATALLGLRNDCPSFSTLSAYSNGSKRFALSCLCVFSCVYTSSATQGCDTRPTGTVAVIVPIVVSQCHSYCYFQVENHLNTTHVVLATLCYQAVSLKADIRAEKAQCKLLNCEYLLNATCLTGEMATGKNRQLASVDALVARDSMGAIPGIGDANPTLPQGSFPHTSGSNLCCSPHEFC